MSRRNSPQPTSIRLTPQLRKRLEKHAEAEGRYLSAFIVHILEQEMDQRDNTPPIVSVRGFPHD